MVRGREPPGGRADLTVGAHSGKGKETVKGQSGEEGSRSDRHTLPLSASPIEKTMLLDNNCSLKPLRLSLEAHDRERVGPRIMETGAREIFW